MTDSDELKWELVAAFRHVPQNVLEELQEKPEPELLSMINAAIETTLNDMYDPQFGDNRLCVCSHPYYRHFDTYDNMAPIGCKYCHYDDCQGFVPAVTKCTNVSGTCLQCEGSGIESSSHEDHRGGVGFVTCSKCNGEGSVSA